jgi:dolichol-phosphate mannosyltransferase
MTWLTAMRAPASKVRPLSLAQLAAGAVVARRLASGATRLPPLAATRPAPATGPGSVTVVIPARNEADRIGPCLAALAADPAVTEVVVVDDESSDSTAAVAAGFGATVVPGRPLPAEWVGKPWALQQGLEAATGEWVLTLDADTIPTTGLAAALIAAASEHRFDVITAGGRFVCRDPAQRGLHASMLASLVYRFGPVGPRQPPRPSRMLGNGQCLLARRTWLAERGGFAVTGGHLTDDIALVRWLAAAGAAVGFVDGSRLLSVEMHRTAGEVWREWGRSLPMADVTPAATQAADLAVVWLTMGLPALRLLTGRGRAVDYALLSMRLGLAAAVRPAYDGPAWPVWLSPLADPLTAVRLTSGALRPARTWRGRTYSVARLSGSAAKTGQP